MRVDKLRVGWVEAAGGSVVKERFCTPEFLHAYAKEGDKGEGGGGRTSPVHFFFSRVAYQIPTRKSQGPRLFKKKRRDLDLQGMQTNERSVLLKPRTYVSTGLWVGSGPRPRGAPAAYCGICYRRVNCISWLIERPPLPTTIILTQICAPTPGSG